MILTIKWHRVSTFLEDFICQEGELDTFVENYIIICRNQSLLWKEDNNASATILPGTKNQLYN